jgi:hypothetical protein
MPVLSAASPWAPAAFLGVLLVDPDKRAQVRERLRKLIHVNVGFDTDGSKSSSISPTRCEPARKLL